MAHTVISAHLPPDIDPTKVQLAFGDRALPKLNEELNSVELITRQKALMALCDVLHNPEYVKRSIQCSIVESLKALLRDNDAVVRMKSTEALLILSRHAIGRQVLIDEAVIPPLAKLFDDDCYDVRLNTHRTVEMISSAPSGADGLVNCDLIPILIKKVPTEEDEIKLLILDSLHRCMRINSTQALASNGMAVYTSLLKHSMEEIRSKAAMDIKELSYPTDGKNKACDEGAVELLVGLLNDEDTSVRSQACAALMVITITTRGKLLTMECGVIPTLIKLLKDECVEVRLNTLKLITTLSETPQGRSELLESLSKISMLKHDHDSQAVRKAAQIAEKSIMWKP
ncbi:radial spoke head 14 homolog isoform X1 [Hydractinia symbiolongicarpus]|uniref:radial spoke head 14 homolog isoform X1 n=1 Tax=Hydractinia symbiolongicarpus TaxID=13093 RepID=UPI002549EEBE|nr:radial spoke head 14 homolog isoform X1 [Hydractinia symbiolongicarpus]